MISLSYHRSVCREITLSTLDINDLLNNILDTIKSFKSLKLEDPGLETESGGNNKGHGMQAF